MSHSELEVGQKAACGDIRIFPENWLVKVNWGFDVLCAPCSSAHEPEKDREQLQNSYVLSDPGYCLVKSNNSVRVVL